MFHDGNSTQLLLVNGSPGDGCRRERLSPRLGTFANHSRQQVARDDFIPRGQPPTDRQECELGVSISQASLTPVISSLSPGCRRVMVAVERLGPTMARQVELFHGLIKSLVILFSSPTWKAGLTSLLQRRSYGIDMDWKVVFISTLGIYLLAFARTLQEGRPGDFP